MLLFLYFINKINLFLFSVDAKINRKASQIENLYLQNWFFEILDT